MTQVYQNAIFSYNFTEKRGSNDGSGIFFYQTSSDDNFLSDKMEGCAGCSVHFSECVETRETKFVLRDI